MGSHSKWIWSQEYLQYYCGVYNNHGELIEYLWQNGDRQPAPANSTQPSPKASSTQPESKQQRIYERREHEPLDPSYRARTTKDSASFFKAGKVLKVYWLESAGDVNRTKSWSRHGNFKSVKDPVYDPEERNIYEIPSYLEQAHLTQALGDSGAKHNFMKEEYALQLGLSINHQDQTEVTIGSGKKVATTGTVQATFRFKNESKMYSLRFHLLPRCLHNVILGRVFLKATGTFKTLANFLQRVVQRSVKGNLPHHLLYLGDSAPTFSGRLNGMAQDALADSGSKVLVMDEDYARTIGLPIVSGSQYSTKLKFADETTTYTSGMTHGVKWEFGPGGVSEVYELDFHILKNAPANVILSDSFLFGTNAFSQFDCYLADEDDEDADTYFYAIDVDEDYSPSRFTSMSFSNGSPLRRFTFTKDSSPHRFNNSISFSTMRHFELVRRGEEEDRISNLSPRLQLEAWNREHERQRQWDERMRRLETRQQQDQHTGSASGPSEASVNTPSPRPTPIGSTTPDTLPHHPVNANAHQHSATHPPPSKRSRWRFRLRRRPMI
ncbi:hypothetical protein K491DRAFT_72355 [Lophiostoma macrostomum CBS 122681]|uniref:Peptidase A2 domain-containing protein n=1 Tax=Lophiostoma macrostomum CBS 122681 TaxID=1314788 RepID=A0A6A6SWA8_9PLEO|nr:hypothetical protein K491DRAFT_72355 [Lophiostoma macrostomum CBS 122681]